MKDKLYQAYCIIGNRFWEYFNEHEITIRRGQLIVKTSRSIATCKLTQIIKDFDLRL